MRYPVSPKGFIEKPGKTSEMIGGPQGKRNSLMGKGCRRKRKPAAARQQEIITGQIGYIPNLKGCRLLPGGSGDEVDE